MAHPVNACNRNIVYASNLLQSIVSGPGPAADFVRHIPSVQNDWIRGCHDIDEDM